MTEGFWDRKVAANRQQLRPYDLPPVGQPLVPAIHRPWWQTATQPQPVPEQVYDNPVGQATGQKRKVHLTDKIEVELDENGQYRPRKASHLKTSDGGCPDCDSPNYGRSTNATARRCFDCGYVDGRNIADVNRPIGTYGGNLPTFGARQISRMNVLDDTGKFVGVANAAGGITENYYGPDPATGVMSGKNILTHINGV